MHSELVDQGWWGMVFFKVKCVEHFGFGVKYSYDLFSL